VDVKSMSFGFVLLAAFLYTHTASAKNSAKLSCDKSGFSLWGSVPGNSPSVKLSIEHNGEKNALMDETTLSALTQEERTAFGKTPPLLVEVSGCTAPKLSYACTFRSVTQNDLFVEIKSQPKTLASPDDEAEIFLFDADIQFNLPLHKDSKITKTKLKAPATFSTEDTKGRTISVPNVKCIWKNLRLDKSI
jgi:hypothetical protein